MFYICHSIPVIFFRQSDVWSLLAAAIKYTPDRESSPRDTTPLRPDSSQVGAAAV